MKIIILFLINVDYPVGGWKSLFKEERTTKRRKKDGKNIRKEEGVRWRKVKERGSKRNTTSKREIKGEVELEQDKKKELEQGC